MADQNLVRGTITPIVLSLLEDRAMYGYEIVKVVNQRSGGQLEWKEGTLYPTLHRLEADGLVRSKWRDRDDVDGAGATGGARQRKYYELTGRGKRELKRSRAEWHDFSSAVSGLLGAPFTGLAKGGAA